MPDGISTRSLGAAIITLVAVMLGGCTAASPSPSPVEVSMPESPTLRSIIEAAPEHPVFELVQETTDFDGDQAEVVAYESGGLQVQAVIRRPPSAAPGSPAMVFVHGSADPDEYSGLTAYDDWADEMVDQGYVVVMPDLRNHADSDEDPAWETDMDIGSTLDVINAARATAADPMVDPDRVAIVGHSSGAGLTLNAAVAAPDAAAAFVAAAPTSAWAWDNVERFATGTPFYETLVAAHGSEKESPEYWHDVSSSSFIDNADAPLLVVHGTADEGVPLEWSERLLEAWERAGKDVQLVAIPGADHNFEPANEVLHETIADFLAERLP